MFRVVKDKPFIKVIISSKVQTCINIESYEIKMSFTLRSPNLSW